MDLPLCSSVVNKLASFWKVSFWETFQVLFPGPSFFSTVPWCLVTASVQEAHDTVRAEPLGGEGRQMLLRGQGSSETQDVPAILSTG